MVWHLINLLDSPIPGWFPKVALIAFGMLVAWFLLFVGGIVFVVVVGGRKALAGQELPAMLARLRDAGHPVRRHQHLHYSAKMSAEIHPLSQAELDEFGFEDDFPE